MRGRQFFIAVIVLLVLLILAQPRRRLCENLLAGFWEAEPSFLKKAGLKDLFMFIKHEDQGWRDGYLLMVDADGTELANVAVDISTGGGIRRSVRGLKAYGASLRGRDVFTGTMWIEGSEALPDRMNFVLQPTQGSLILTANNEVQALLFRNNVASLVLDE